MSASPSSESGLAGLFFDGKRSVGHVAHIRLVDDDLLLDLGGREERFPAVQAKLGTQVGQAVSYLWLGGGAVFESGDQAGLAKLARLAGGQPGEPAWLHRLETSWRLILASAVLVIALFAASLAWGVPWLSSTIAHAVPPKLEAWVGEQSLQTLDQLWMEPSKLDQARQEAVQSAFQAHLLALETDYPGHGLRVLLRSSDAIGANALALPGGVIVFTDDLVRLAEDDDELVAILAHEVGHVIHRHSLRGIVQSSLALWLVLSITGDMSAASDLTTSLPAILTNLGYARAMEWEADGFALDYLLQSNIDPMHFAHIMQRLQAAQDAESDSSRFSEFLSSHPPTTDRIQRFVEASEAR